jgi:hypothetical protein
MSVTTSSTEWSAAASGLLGALALFLTLSPTSLRAATERFTALAVNMGSPGPAGAGAVEIVVNRWSTDGERDRLLAVLLENGPEKLLDALRKLPRAGYIRTPESLGYDLRFAQKLPGEDGDERIVLATDRYIGFWEAVNRPRTIDYPFTVIELRLNRDGEGEGKLSLFTRITADKRNRTIVLEDYGTQPVLLQSVRRRTSSN